MILRVLGFAVTFYRVFICFVTEIMLILINAAIYAFN